jgi:metal transporter CNNM
MGVTGSDIGTFEGKGAVNFLALDSRRVTDEGSILDPSSIISLTVASGTLGLPKPREPVWNDFLKRVNESGKRWVVLTDSAESRFLLLDADAFLRTAFATSHSDIDPSDHCVEPLVTRNPDDTLERVLTHGNLSENHSPDRGIILLWGEQKRIISHFDVLKRLFEGVVTPMPLHNRRTPG